VTEVPNPYIIDADTLTGEMRPIRRAVLSLGSNLGDRLANLQDALNTLAETPDVWVTTISPVYETEPVDSPADAELYLNAIVLADTTLTPTRLLERALTIEDAYGRSRSGIFNEPRTLDIDVISVGDKILEEESLTLPHPRAHQRAFVLKPWLDLEPSADLPGVGPIAELLEQSDQSGITRRDDLTLDL